jgi:uncharacterized protein YidB (DUF937 family)
MGLLDVINGMQNGPHGQRSGAPASSGGMSPITMAILGLLAYKAVKHVTGGQTAPTSSPRGGTTTANAGEGGLGSLLPGGLGGLLAGGAAGSVLSGGLGDLLKQFQQNGHGDVAGSWVSNGPNKEISPSTLSQVLSPEQIKTISDMTGMSPDELMKTLSQQLPGVINHMTPDGRLPTEHETSRMI